MDTATYDHLADTSDPWLCPSCGTPNHSTILYDIPATTDDSIGSINSSDTDDTCSTPSHTSSLHSQSKLNSTASSLGSPSSPKPTPVHTPRKKRLRIVTMNCKSICKKGKNIDVLVETTSPDVIIATETWLNSEIKSSEFFDPSLGYNIYRNDRKSDAHGGVLIAIKNHLEFTNVTSSADIEFLSGTLQLPQKKKMVIGAYYRPPDRVDEEYLYKTNEAISALRDKYKKAVFINSGDFNLPDIHWPSNSIRGNAYPHRVSQRFLEISQDLALEQMVDFTTRNQNILDLVLTSHPAFMIRCSRLPPLGAKSDHDIVLYDSAHEVVRTRQPLRKILLWKNVDKESTKQACAELCHSFHGSTFSSVDDMWTFFKTGLLGILDSHIPSKTSSTRFTHPWISTKTRHLSRRKARAYRKAKNTNNMKDWCKYKSLKAETQREMRRAHQAYIQDTVNQDLTANSKRFYSYVKSKKQETTGISPLLNQDGFLHSRSTSKAEILNHQFQSVYTKDNLTNITDIGQSKIPSMKPIIISTPGVIKLLKHLKPHKASGPDNISTRLLIMVAEEIAPMLTTIF